MNLKEQLLNNLIIDKKQGYAFYFEENNSVLEYYNGVENLETQKKIDANSNFRLASVSKQFIAHGIMKLIDGNKLKYDTKLKEIFNNIPKYMQDISIINLLNHISKVYMF